MRSLKRINYALLQQLNALTISNLVNLTGGLTQKTAGSTLTVGADRKLKQCDWTDKQDYTVTKDGIIFGQPYGFEVIECCLPAINNSIDTAPDKLNVNENYD